MGSGVWVSSAVITGIWGFIHFVFLFDMIGASTTVYHEMVMAITATIFTLSLIATLFFVSKSVDAMDSEEKEKRKESEIVKNE